MVNIVQQTPLQVTLPMRSGPWFFFWPTPLQSYMNSTQNQRWFDLPFSLKTIGAKWVFNNNFDTIQYFDSSEKKALWQFKKNFTLTASWFSKEMHHFSRLLLVRGLESVSVCGQTLQSYLGDPLQSYLGKAAGHCRITWGSPKHCCRASQGRPLAGRRCVWWRPTASPAPSRPPPPGRRSAPPGQEQGPLRVGWVGSKVTFTQRDSDWSISEALVRIILGGY